MTGQQASQMVRPSSAGRGRADNRGRAAKTGRGRYRMSEASKDDPGLQESQNLSNDNDLLGLSLDGQITTEGKPKFKLERWSRVIDVDADSALQI